MGIFTVKQLHDYIAEKLDKDRTLANIWVRGELFNVKTHTSGHIYFTLKDGEAGMRCVMFRSRSMFLKFEPRSGMQVLIGGRVSIYERDGSCQIYAHSMQPDGVGSLSLALEQLKQKLSEEGLFDDERKKMLPPFPRTVGIITSLTGAALRDIVQVSKRRNPAIQLLLYPVLVQGEEAPRQLVRAIQLLNGSLPKNVPVPDILIVGRGGGSLEELWAFNDEQVVRAVSNSHIPIISAVGHETDFTLCDFAADKRASTPSVAAELAVPNVVELARYTDALQQRLSHSTYTKLSSCRDQLQALMKRRVMRRPEEQINQRRQYLDQLHQRLMAAVRVKRQTAVAALTLTARQLQVLSPLQCLSRGYSIVTDRTGHTVATVAAVQTGQQLLVMMQDGTLECEVMGKKGIRHEWNQAQKQSTGTTADI